MRGATEAINFVAKSWGRKFIGKDDEIVVSQLEHHANIVPWQMLCAETGAKLRVIPVDDTGQFLLDEYERLLNSRTKFVSFTQVLNALGTITPAQQMVQMAHRYGARMLVDGAQAVSHMRVDVQWLDCDIYVFSGHKVFGPTGIGIVYGKQDVLAETPPWQDGGNMIVDVTFEKTIYQPPPGRFEAGTGNIADAVGLGAAIAYLDRIGMENISRHEHELLVYATRESLQIPGLCVIGTAKEKAGVMSFVLEGHRTEDVGAALNREGIAVRSGHHCAQPDSAPLWTGDDSAALARPLQQLRGHRPDDRRASPDQELTCYFGRNCANHAEAPFPFCLSFPTGSAFPACTAQDYTLTRARSVAAALRTESSVPSRIRSFAAIIPCTRDSRS